MKTTLAMVLGFAFSVLGCGVPVDENAATVEEEAQALTAYNGHCEVVSSNHTGHCRAVNGNACAKSAAVVPECVGTPIVLPYSTKCGSFRVGTDATPCSFTQ